MHLLWLPRPHPGRTDPGGMASWQECSSQVFEQGASVQPPSQALLSSWPSPVTVASGFPPQLPSASQGYRLWASPQASVAPASLRRGQRGPVGCCGCAEPWVAVVEGSGSEAGSRGPSLWPHVQQVWLSSLLLCPSAPTCGCCPVPTHTDLQLLLRALGLVPCGHPCLFALIWAAPRPASQRRVLPPADRAGQSLTTTSSHRGGAGPVGA